MSAYLEQVADLLREVDSEAVVALVNLLVRAWEADRQVFVCGNGGSASLASHVACDLSRQTMVPGRRALRATALTDNVAILTAWANDSEFERVFSEQLAVHGRAGDVLLCISASGNSPNILAAIGEAQRGGLTVAGLGGFDGGEMSQRCDVYVHVPGSDYGMVESVHLVLQHCLAATLRQFDTENHQGLQTERGKPVVMVDRDGVINRNRDRSVLSWPEFEFLPGALEGLAHLASHGHPVVVVTNQAAVGRGDLSRARLDEIHRRMREEILRAGGDVAAVYVCQHTPDDACECRKPAPGLLLQAARELDFDLADAYLVGDHRTDIESARAAGTRAVLVLSGRETTALGVGHTADLVAADLLGAARLLVDSHNGAPITEPAAGSGPGRELEVG